MDDHAHEGHAHTHAAHVHAAPGNLGAKLVFSIVLNVAITVAQLIGGVLSGSLALISDAAHNASDVMGLVLSYTAHRAGQRPPTAQRTFAFKRAEVLAAFVNAAVLLGVSIWVLIEGIGRIISPQPVEGQIVIVLATVGLIGNTVAAVLLHGGQNLNVRSAFLHLVADAVTSLGVVLAGVIMVLTGWSAADGVVSVLLSLWMMREAFAIVRASTDILLESTPEGMDLTLVQEMITSESLIEEVHDLHVWSLSSTEIALSAHLVTGCDELPALSEVVASLKEELRAHFGIAHATFELECAGGACAGGRCLLPHED